MNFMKDDDRIYTQATGQKEIDLIAESNSIFKVKGVNARVKFHLKNDGTADTLTLIQHGKHKAVKIKPSEKNDLSEFKGSFYSVEIETVYHIVMNDKQLEISSFLFPENIKLEYAKNDTFGGGYPIESLKFLRNKKHEIIGFVVDNGRTSRVRFDKMSKDFIPLETN